MVNDNVKWLDKLLNDTNNEMILLNPPIEDRDDQLRRWKMGERWKKIYEEDGPSTQIDNETILVIAAKKSERRLAKEKAAKAEAAKAARAAAKAATPKKKKAAATPKKEPVVKKEPTPSKSKSKK